jgi:hypothetical protein
MGSRLVDSDRFESPRVADAWPDSDSMRDANGEVRRQSYTVAPSGSVALFRECDTAPGYAPSSSHRPPRWWSPRREIGWGRTEGAWWWFGGRCARLLVVFPRDLRGALEECRRLRVAYRRTVAPIVRARVGPSERQAEIDDRLAAWAVQGGYLVESYAHLAGLGDVEDVAVVLGSLLRVYDDVLDERPDGSAVGERLRRLFDGEEIAPESDVEWIVVDLFRWLAPRVPPSSRDPVLAYLRDLHSLQLQGLEPGPQVTPSEIVQHALQKGGAALAILAGSINPRVEADEWALLYRLGGLLQLIDDYDDAHEDRATVTSATSGRVAFGTLAAELRAVSRDITSLYGAERAQPFLDRLIFWFVVIGVRRMRDRARPRRLDAEPASSPKRSLEMIAQRKAHIR